MAVAFRFRTGNQESFIVSERSERSYVVKRSGPRAKRSSDVEFFSEVCLDHVLIALDFGRRTWAKNSTSELRFARGPLRLTTHDRSLRSLTMNDSWSPVVNRPSLAIPYD